MLTVYDSNGKSYELSKQIGRGGEGTVFQCPENYEIVAKIYHEPITDEKAEKIRWMADNKNEQLLKVAAWIVDTLHDAPNGKVVGFLMPNVRAKEIHELYSLKSRRIHFPEATWQFLIHSATNLARAFYNLHKNDHVVGDVNHGNCVVLADGTVKLIDCDSYSISKGDFRYSCDVGVSTHLPPELQGVNLRGTERKENHDNFGLAVIIFQLLFLGRHPFAGNYLGTDDKSLEDCIRELRFPYSSDAKLRLVKQPPGTLSLSDISPRISLMFERAFLTEDRPQAREWIEALNDLQSCLIQCTLHPGHQYFQELAHCPWCNPETQTGLLLFPFVNRKALNGEEEPLNVFTIESLISSFGVSTDIPAKLPKPLLMPPPDSEFLSIRKSNLLKISLICLGQVFIIGLGIFDLDWFASCFFGIFAMIIGIIYLANVNKSLRQSLQDKLIEVEYEWEKLEQTWKKTDIKTQFEDQLAMVRTRVSTYEGLQRENQLKIKKRTDEKYRIELQNYLEKFSIETSDIPEIDKNRLARLKVLGVRNAATIESGVLRFSSELDKYAVQKLLEWRKSLETDFANNAKIEIEEEEKSKISLEFAEIRRGIEREIENLLVNLRASAARLNYRNNQLLNRSQQVAANLMQSKSNVSAVGTAAQPIAVLILTTFITLTFGGLFSGATFGNSKNIYRVPAPSAPAPVRAKTDSSTRTLAPGEIYGRDGQPVKPMIVPENISDSEIAALSKAEKELAVQSLYTTASDLAYRNNKYDEAEDKLRLALRIEPKDSRTLFELGTVLYKRKKFDEAINTFKEYRKYNPDEDSSLNYIGLAYYELKNYQAAVNHFEQVSGESSYMTDLEYKIGMSYKELGANEMAVKHFEAATLADYSDVDSHYEYGLSLIKTGNWFDAKGQIEILNNLDGSKAEKLRKQLTSASK